VILLFFFFFSVSFKESGKEAKGVWTRSTKSTREELATRLPLLTLWLVDRWRVEHQTKTKHDNNNISWGLQHF